MEVRKTKSKIGNKAINDTYIIHIKVNENNSMNVGSKDDFTIGWSVNEVAREFYHSMDEGVFSKTRELGMEVIPHDEKGDTTRMITGALDLIDQGIDALVISPIEPEAMPIVSDAAREAGIHIVVLDTGYDDADIDAFIVSDSLGGGILAGEYALELIDKYNLTSKNVAIITAEDKFIYARRRGTGFRNVMEESGYDVVAELSGNSNTLDGYLAMKEIFRQHGDDLAVVFAENDRMALGAAQAILEEGKTGQIMLIGFDAEPSALQAIEEGLLQGTIGQNAFEMGELGVETAYKLLTRAPIAFDDRINKELYIEVYLVDENGEAKGRTLV